MKKYCIKVKKKGFNYYTDYMERYFDNVAKEYGLHLTKRNNQADMWCTAFVSVPGSAVKWMTFASPLFDSLTLMQLEKLTQLIGVCFKSESKLEESEDVLGELALLSKAAQESRDYSKFRDFCEHGYGIPERFMFSRKYSAFDEPVYISEGETVFKKSSYDAYRISGKSYSVTALNTGGPSKGISFDISFSDNCEIMIENQRWSVWKNNSMPTQESFEFEQTVYNDRIRFHSDLPDFEIHCGFNEYSTKLVGKGKMNAATKCEISLLFTPYGKDSALRDMEVMITPNLNPEGKVVFS